MTQVDDIYVGGKNNGRGKHTQGRSLKKKILVIGLLSDGKIRTFVAPNTSGKILKVSIYNLV